MSSSGSTQLVRHNTEVYVRILPENNANLENFKVLEDKKSIYVRSWQDFAKGKDDPEPNYLVFQTNGIFYNHSQEAIFTSVTDNGLFDKLIYGNNAMILCYGQTGSGKTLTTAGLESTYENRGLLPRILETLFEKKQQLVEKFKITIKMRYVETNRNYMLDLLSDEGVVHDMNNYKNIKSIKVATLYEGLKLIFKGEARKTVRNNFYYKSNMGNTIVTFSVFTKGHNTAVSEGTLHVVDLAGVDTVGNQSCWHKNGYEVGNGNLAKSQIEQLIQVINENYSKNAEIKQRLCIIIHYLRNVINSKSTLRVIAHIRMNRPDLKISTSMLRLGCSFKGMVPKKLSRFLETSIDVQYHVVADELKSLKKEMELNAMLCDEDMSCQLSEERLDYIKRLAIEYLDGDASELVLLSTTDTMIVMKVIKSIYKKILEDNRNLSTQIQFSPSIIKLNRRSIKSSTESNSAGQTQVVNTRRILSSQSNVSTDSRRKASKRLSQKSTKTKFEVQDTNKSSQLKDTYSAFSGPSVLSKNTSKTRVSKKKRTQSTDIRMSQFVAPSLIKLPEEIPSFATAWSKFKEDEKAVYAELEQHQKLFNNDLETMTKTYNKEVLTLTEMKNVANRRKNEFNHATMISDIDTLPQTLDDLYEFQENCGELSMRADRQVLEQKEKLLTLQAELQLTLEYKAKLQDDIHKKFGEFCLKHYGVLIPEISANQQPFKTADLTATSNTDDIKVNDKTSEYMMDSPNNYMNSLYCMNQNRFEKLKSYMRRELTRVWKRKVQNQKWILTFHAGPQCAAKLNY